MCCWSFLRVSGSLIPDSGVFISCIFQDPTPTLVLGQAGPLTLQQWERNSKELRLWETLCPWEQWEEETISNRGYCCLPFGRTMPVSRNQTGSSCMERTRCLETTRRSCMTVSAGFPAIPAGCHKCQFDDTFLCSRLGSSSICLML